MFYIQNTLSSPHFHEQSILAKGIFYTRHIKNQPWLIHSSRGCYDLSVFHLNTSFPLKGSVVVQWCLGRVWHVMPLWITLCKWLLKQPSSPGCEQDRSNSGVTQHSARNGHQFEETNPPAGEDTDSQDIKYHWSSYLKVYVFVKQMFYDQVSKQSMKLVFCKSSLKEERRWMTGLASGRTSVICWHKL